MGDLISGRILGDRLKDMMGLPKNTRGFELRCYVNEIVTVKCEYYPEIDDVEQFASVIKKFHLGEIKEDEKEEIKICNVCGNPATIEMQEEDGATKYYCDLHESCKKLEMGEDDAISDNTK